MHDALKDFVKAGDVSGELISRYEGLLPEEVIAIWRECGFGTFYNGYLKVIDPDSYTQLLRGSYFRGDVSIPVFATAFGDIITWEKGRYLGIVKYRYGVNEVISDGFDYFLDDLVDEDCEEENFTIDKYNEAVEQLGGLEYNECFGYVPLLALGGKESVEQLKKVKLREHIALITGLVGEI